MATEIQPLGHASTPSTRPPPVPVLSAHGTIVLHPLCVWPLAPTAHIETDPMAPAPSSEAWWDVPVAEVSELDATRRARDAYEKAKPAQRPLIGPEGR